jgi:tetratricopeptide (TPR) repeat protein
MTKTRKSPLLLRHGLALVSYVRCEWAGRARASVKLSRSDPTPYGIIMALCVSGLFHMGCNEQTSLQTQNRASQAAAEAASSSLTGSTSQDQLTGQDHYAKGNSLAFGYAEMALKEYKLAIKKGYDTVEVRIALGMLLDKELKRPAEAVEHLRIAAQRDEKSWRAHWSLARALLDAEQFDEAFKEFTRAKKLDPEFDGLYYYYIGRSLEGMGRYADALTNYEEFLKYEKSIAPNAPEIVEVNERIKAIKEKMYLIDDTQPTRLPSPLPIARVGRE